MAKYTTKVSARYFDDEIIDKMLDELFEPGTAEYDVWALVRLG